MPKCLYDLFTFHKMSSVQQGHILCYTFAYNAQISAEVCHTHLHTHTCIVWIRKVHSMTI